MVADYRFDPRLSQFRVQAFAAGMLSYFGHSPTFVVRDFHGWVRFEGGRVSGLRLELAVNPAGLELMDEMRPGDRAEIEGRMYREVLETAVYREIGYEARSAAAERIALGHYRVRIDGRLSLHGVTRGHPLEADLLVFNDGLRLRGESPVRTSDHAIRPVTALAGAIKLDDVLRVSFDVAAVPEKGV